MFLTQLDGLFASRLATCIQVLITPSSAVAQCKALEGFFLKPLYFLKAICNYICVLAVKMTKSFLRKVRCDFDKFTKNLFVVSNFSQLSHEQLRSAVASTKDFFYSVFYNSRGRGHFIALCHIVN